MAMRRNAGRGMARITELVHAIAMSHQPNAVGAIGHIDVYPNSPQHHRRARSSSPSTSARHILDDAERHGRAELEEGAEDRA